MRGLVFLSVLALLPAALSAQDDPALEGRFRSEPFDVYGAFPTGWIRKDSQHPILLRVVAPEGGPKNGSITLSTHTLPTPTTIKAVAAEFREKAPGLFAAYAPVAETEIDAAGVPGVAITFTATMKADARQVVGFHGVLLRSADEAFHVDASADPAEKDKVFDLATRVLKSLRFGLPLPDEVKAQLAKAAEVLKGSAVEPGLLGTRWYKILFAGEKLGWQRFTVREEKVGDKPGYAFEQELVRQDKEGGRNAILVRGQCLPDGSYQRVEYQEVIEGPGRPKLEFKETASIDRGEYFADRTLRGESRQAKARAPEGAYLAGVADLVRSRLSAAPIGTYAIRLISPFREHPATDRFEVASRGKVKTADGEQELVTVLVQAQRRAMEEYLYDAKGGLYQSSGAKNPVVIRLCTEAEAKK